MGRRYRQCDWCGKTNDVTNNDDELCKDCAKYSNYREMVKAAAESFNYQSDDGNKPLKKEE